MVSYTRSHGANARAQGWDDLDEQAQRRGNWLPLDALDDEELYAGTPQLHAIPAPRGETYAPAKAQPGRRDRTALHPTRAQTAERAVAAPRQRTHVETGMKGVQARAVAMVAGAALCALALYVMLSMVVEWTQVKLDDFQYGRPRTFQLDAYVGHSETDGVPSHFVAMNLNRRVTVLEMPGSDSSKVSTITGPYLFGQGEDLTPVQLNAQDVNADGKPDLVVSVKNEQLIYLNDGATFKLMTPEERAALQKTLAATQSKSGTGAAPTGEAGK